MRSIPLFLMVAVQVFSQTTATGRVQIQTRNATGAINTPPPPPTSFNCSADGTVVNSVTGEPIPRARVTLISVSNSAANSATTTDGSGRWSLTNVACGILQVNVARPGFLRTAGAPGNSAINLATSTAVHDIKTQLVPQAVVIGKVVDDQGDPLMGIQISVLAARVVEGLVRFQQAGGGATNDLGEYRIASLARGRYIFCARTNQQLTLFAGGTETLTAESCYPGPPDGGAAAAMELPAGRETKVDFTLRQVPAVHVRGTVAGLAPGRGMGISLAPRQSAGTQPGGNIPGNVRDGKFDIRVVPGSYMLMADYFDAGKHLTARMPIDVGGGDIDNVTVNLETGFTVHGVVRIESQAQPSPAFKPFGVNLRPSDPGSATGQLKWQQDGASFEMDGMMPGNYRLYLSPPAPFYVKSASLAGQDILHAEIPISQSAGPLEIVLRDDGGSIEGDVVDSNGQTVTAGVMLLRDGVRVANPLPQTNGHFRIPNLAPGDYVAYAWDDMNAVEYANPDWMRRYAGAGVRVKVSAGQATQVKLTQQTAGTGTP